MKIHLVTVGAPKLAYAQHGWEEYRQRLAHYHQLRTTHIPDKHNDAEHLQATIGAAYLVTLEITGKQLSSPELAAFLEKRALDGRETCFVIGGPEGLPAQITETADFHWSFSQLTFPHDLAMIILLESLYRASTINSGHPYHK